jgi:hypothetical protein
MIAVMDDETHNALLAEMSTKTLTEVEIVEDSAPTLATLRADSCSNWPGLLPNRTQTVTVSGAQSKPSARTLIAVG